MRPTDYNTNWDKMNNDDKEKSKTPAKKASPAPKKVFDVVRPGKAPAAPNSRNVIVGHKKPVKDDMFVAGKESHGVRATNPNQKRDLMDTDKRKSINPVSKDAIERGLDLIGTTLIHEEDISAYEAEKLAYVPRG